MVPFAFASLVHGPLSDAIGRRPVMIWGMALYTVGSVACTFAPNYESLIAARVLQGATAGVGVVIGRAVIRDLYEGARAQRLMSLTTMIFSIAPAVAPIIGGWVHVAFGWRAVFAVMVLCGVVFAFAAWWKLPETHPAAARIPFNARNLVVHLADGAAPSGIPDAGARGRASTSARIACYIGSAPGDRREALGHERDLVLRAVPAGDRRHPASAPSSPAASPAASTWRARCASALAITFARGADARARCTWRSTDLPIPLQQALLFVAAIGAQFAFPVLTLRMLDLFPAARGTAASAQSFVALLITAFTLGIVSPKVLPHLRLDRLDVAGLRPSLASMCWYLSRRWHDRASAVGSSQA